MRSRLLTAVFILVLLFAAGIVGGCSASTPAETPVAAELDTALAIASTSAGEASTYVLGLKQGLPGAPSNDQLQELQTTLNAAVSQAGAAQRASAQDALAQFESGIATATEALDASGEGSPQQDQLTELVATLVTGRDALAEALK